ncbi:acetylornithine deacetylase [uncultured Roseobacter sp.]|uniref:acetylornithine deacetylase n=1 Tax=uncultured Roseobacter sp. TaxID=114847 RepID=UPI00262551FD|nr:acetylornithine deacetylase [uncultured Roseobacter sp.]
MQDTLTILERLCAFDTTSHKSNQDCVEYCRHLLVSAGFDITVLPNADGTKANLHAVAGHKDGPALVLAGHTDVVPVDGQNWSTDPFKLTQRDGNLFARGTTDMKGFVAVALSVATNLNLDALGLSLHLVLTHDEETGCFGARDISDYLRSVIPAESFCMVGEPTDLRPVVAHKGIIGLRATVNGSEGHAATIATKTNAIHYASDLVQYLMQQEQVYAAKPAQDGYDTPYSTIQVGLIRGGQARNMIAKQCTLEFEFRHLPDNPSKSFMTNLETFLSTDLRPGLNRNDDEASIQIEILSHVPAFKAREPSGFLPVLQADPRAAKVKFWDGVTEAGYYQNAGLDTVVCGPGSISQAHQPDEYVSEKDLHECEDFLHRLISRLGAT